MNLATETTSKVISVFMAVVSVIGNALVCHVIVRLKTMKTSINYIILNMAILDAVIGVFSISYVILFDNPGLFGDSVVSQAFNKSSEMSDGICKVHWMMWLPFTTSPSILTLMAYERYKAITDPLSRLDVTVTKARLKWMLPLAWLLGVAYLICDIIVIKYDSQSKLCRFIDLPYWYRHKFVSVFYLIAQTIIPSTAMLILYGRVVCALRKQDNSLGPQAEAERARRKARKKVMWVIIVVTLAFYICSGVPHALYAVFVFYGHSFFVLLVDINLMLLTINCAFNPFVYFIFIKSFRDGFRRVFMMPRQRIIPPNNEMEMNRRPEHSLDTVNDESAI